MSDKEIEDPAHYVKLDVKKIEAVNGLLQLVQQNQLKADRAEIIKQKYWTTKSSPKSIILYCTNTGDLNHQDKEKTM
jgi:hypothetical protein